MTKIRLGVIGGSGLYEMPGLEKRRESRVTTPFGDPSDPLVVGELDGEPVAFLPRHGRGHRLLPSEVNYRANVFAMKKLGAEFVLSVSAVGSLRKAIRPGDVVVPDQFIDWTRSRQNTFFGDGVVAHASLADPICAELAATVAKVLRQDRKATKSRSRVHEGGTYVCIEGPQFSTRAESHLYRKWGADIIGMTNATEARLAREAGIGYATLAIATDYDCWNPDAGDVEVSEILRILGENTERAQRVVRALVGRLPAQNPCGAGLGEAVITDPSKISAAMRKKLGPILG